MSKTGTKEWASKTVNVVDGCEHNCRYCYARYNACYRFHRIDHDQWTTMKVRQHEVEKGRGKSHGVIMFPSQHDITPSVLDPCITVLMKLLDAGNMVLLVTKPHWECISKIVDECHHHRGRLRFRFTIGALSDDVLSFWEPGAPKFQERLECLKLAQFAGYKTSISAEPLLEPWMAYNLYERLAPYVNWEFWIGKLNRADQRVILDADGERGLFDKLLKWQTDRSVWDIYRRLNGKPCIRWKDSYRAVIDKFTKGDRLP